MAVQVVCKYPCVAMLFLIIKKLAQSVVPAFLFYIFLKEEIKMRGYCTIREAAKLPEVPFAEYTLRKMNRDGKIPGVYAGKKFLINLDAFLHEIEIRCAEASK